jgi:hypothetical protein
MLGRLMRCPGPDRTNFQLATPPRFFCTHACVATALVFSKSRALQLDGLLDSLFLHVRDPERLAVRVLFAAPGDHAFQYGALRAKWHEAGAMFVHEDDFAADLRRVLKYAAPVTLFFVDDTLLLRPFTARDLAAALDADAAAVGFSLRLGDHITWSFAQRRPAAPPAMESVTVAGAGARPDAVRAFRWSGASTDFGYPLELSSSAYRTAELRDWLGAAAPANPNRLEEHLAGLAHTLARARPRLLTYATARAVSLPLNVVQTTFENRNGGKSVDDFTRAFNEGFRVDTRRYFGHVSNSVHELLPLYLLDQATGKTKLL